MPRLVDALEVRVEPDRSSVPPFGARARLAAAALAGVLLVGALAVAWLGRAASDRLDETLDRLAIAQARELAASVCSAAAGECHGESALPPAEAVVRAARAPGVREAAWLDAAGRIVASSDSSGVGRELAGPERLAPDRREPTLSRVSEDGNTLVQVLVPVLAPDGRRLGIALLRIDPAPAGSGLGSAIGGALGLLGLGALCVAFLLARLLGSLLTPLGRLRDALERLARGDLSIAQEPLAPGSAELAGLAGALEDLSGGLGTVVDRVNQLVGQLTAAPARISNGLDEIASGSEAQTEAVEETASLLANINTSIRGINGEVESLSSSTEEASSSILQMGTSIEEVARSAAKLHETVEGSTSALHEMGASIRQVADGADEVHRTAEETAASMLQMDRVIQEVGEHVREASVLTQQVSMGAEDGSSAVVATIEGIEEIRTLTRGAQAVLGRLADRIAEIGEIVNVIGAINDETNLLSLNAAIIAAQAGEQGKAFAVVANHVKTLAQRTSASTQEIERLIRAVQDESKNAMAAMATGSEAVETGVTRSRRAGEALQTIRSSSHSASARVAEIARAADEQARSSRHVAEAAQRTSRMVQQISGAIAEQSRASEQMLRSAESSLEMCRQVHRSTSEQRETAKFITASISSITEMTQSIRRNTASHQAASDAVSDAVTRILDIARKNTGRIPEVLADVESLRADAESLAQEIGRFRR